MFAKAGLLALVALVGLVAAAPAAHAVGQFNTEAGTSTLVAGEAGDHEYYFGSFGTTVDCNSEQFNNSVADGSTSLTLKPVHTNCTAFGFLSATVTNAGCNFAIGVGSTTTLDVFTGTLSIACSGGNTLVFTGGTCELVIGNQGPLSGVIVQNNTAVSPRDMTLTYKVTGIAYSVLKDGFLCPLSGTGNFFNGEYTGSVTLRGHHSGSFTGINWED